VAKKVTRYWVFELPNVGEIHSRAYAKRVGFVDVQSSVDHKKTLAVARKKYGLKNSVGLSTNRSWRLGEPKVRFCDIIRSRYETAND
jgi:hypothetical protein